MSRIAHVFVAIVFTVLGASFLLSTGLLIREFRDLDWPTLLIAHSHLFIFFPTLGLLALAAFYVPSVVFTDLYWRHLRFGRVRFVLGGIVAVIVSLLFANALSLGAVRGIWEIAPRALEQDAAAAGVTCTDTKGDACRRQRILPTLQRLRAEGLHRSTVSGFARNCSPDPLLERAEADKALRYCFPADARLTTDDCCRVQRAFAEAVAERWSGSETRSQMADWELYLLPFKVFFVVVVVVIGVFLTLWRRQLDEHYPAHIPAVERGVVVGAIAMLFWPLMDYGYQQTIDVLFGRMTTNLPVRYSLVVAPWAVLLMFYFMQRLGKDMERLAQFSTIAASAVAILRYQEINDWSARLLGTGADWWHFAVVGVLALAGLALLVWPWRGTRHAFDMRRPERIVRHRTEA